MSVPRPAPEHRDSGRTPARSREGWTKPSALPCTVRPDRFLYAWQLDALTAWLRCGRRGVVEAVTGSGKTEMAMAAIADAHRRGLFVLVVVPTRVLIAQWHERLTTAFPDLAVGRLGDNQRDRPDHCDVLIATRHSAASRRPVPDEGQGGLLIADECHGFGGGILRKSLIGAYNERLGLTATLERSDDAIERVILPYFGGVCFRYDFSAAIEDGVCAQPRVAFVSVPLESQERADYVATEQQLVDARRVLRAIPQMPASFAEFLAVVAHLAEKDSSANGRAAREYLDALGKRREIVANSAAKHKALTTLAPTIRNAAGALVFTETVRAANHAINRLDSELSIEIITGDTPRSAREDLLGALRAGELDAVAAPRVLDEGVDVPNANLGVVVSASRTRRQMIQRMGRVLRRKPPGIGARFVILFAQDTLEDPTATEDRDGFLDEIEAISDQTRVFPFTDIDRVESFLAWNGPGEVPEPTRITAERTVEVEPDRWDIVRKDAAEMDRAEALERELGTEAMYARLNYLEWHETNWLHRWISPRIADTPREKPVEDVPYLQIERLPMPGLVKPRPKKKLLSTGDSPVAILDTEGGFALRCTGCGALSEPVTFRWQALDQTVECQCNEW
jgi:RNA polymerase primary sigma factor